jgi:acetyltransferase
MSESFLDQLFEPRSIALVGASDKQGKIGFFYLQNLLQYDGEIYPVNPSGGEMLGLQAYTRVSAIKKPVDLAVIVVPSGAVLDVVDDCAKAGVKVAIVTTAGFSETGDEGSAKQAKMLEIARAAGMRIIGPNCFGIRNCHNGLNATFSFQDSVAGGPISFITQSGGGGEVIYTQGRDEGLQFGKFMVSGNKSDVQDYEVLDYLAGDPQTQLICLFLESIEEGRKFFESAQKISAAKPIVVCKIGRTEGASRAAASHTAALAGDHTAYTTAFKQAGLIEASSGQELLDVCKVLSWQPLPKGRRVGIITASGGLGVELTDLVEETGLLVPETDAHTQERIQKMIPDFASARNPVDTTPVWSTYGAVMENTIEAFQESDQIDIIVPIIVLRATRTVEHIEAVRDIIVNLSSKYASPKPVYVCWVSERTAARNKEILEQAKIPVFESTGRLVRSASLVCDYATYVEKRNKSGTGKESLTTLPSGEKAQQAEQIFAQAREQDRRYILEYEVKRILADFGVDTTREIICETAQQATDAAKEIGYPVVMKMVSDAVVHKSDIGGVAVGLKDQAAVEQTFHSMQSIFKKNWPIEKLTGISLQEMVSGEEVIIGAVKDPQFGQMLMVGMGGVFVEVFEDVAYRLAPVSEDEALEMLMQLKGHKLLQGYRGSQGVDMPSLCKTIARVSNVLTQLPEITEMDLNPIFANQDRVVVADARMFI